MLIIVKSERIAESRLAIKTLPYKKCHLIKRDISMYEI